MKRKISNENWAAAIRGMVLNGASFLQIQLAIGITEAELNYLLKLGNTPAPNYYPCSTIVNFMINGTMMPTEP